MQTVKSLVRHRNDEQQKPSSTPQAGEQAATETTRSTIGFLKDYKRKAIALFSAFSVANLVDYLSTAANLAKGSPELNPVVIELSKLANMGVLDTAICIKLGVTVVLGAATIKGIRSKDNHVKGGVLLTLGALTAITALTDVGNIANLLSLS